MMDFLISKREYGQKAVKLEIKITFKCCKCEKEVEPDRIDIGRAHIYALHCNVMQEVGVIA